MTNKLSVGDLIKWQKYPDEQFVAVGILFRRFDVYREMEIASVAYRPKYHWYIIFSGEEPDDYYKETGASEISLLSGVHGEIIQVGDQK